MSYHLDPQHIFILFFIMLGPVKLIAPYAKATQAMEVSALRVLSFKAAGLSAVIIIVGAFAGKFLLYKWGVGIPSLMLTAGIIFFLTALRIVMPPVFPVQYAELNATAAEPRVTQIVFPMILTPYGIAAAIILLAASGGMDRTLVISSLILLNIFLDLLAMIWVRPILRIITPTGMQIVFSVLGILMVALALEITLGALRALHIIPAAG